MNKRSRNLHSAQGAETIQSAVEAGALKVRCADDAVRSAWTKLLVATQSDERHAKAPGVVSFHPKINGRLANAPQKIAQETLS